MIRTVAMLGRGNTKEFVTEYVIMYSDDGEQWRPYVNPDGEVQVIPDNNHPLIYIHS